MLTSFNSPSPLSHQNYLLNFPCIPALLKPETILPLFSHFLTIHSQGHSTGGNLQKNLSVFYCQSPLSHPKYLSSLISILLYPNSFFLRIGYLYNLIQGKENLFFAKGHFDIFILNYGSHKYFNLKINLLYICCILSPICNCLRKSRPSDFTGLIHSEGQMDVPNQHCTTIHLFLYLDLYIF